MRSPAPEARGNICCRGVLGHHSAMSMKQWVWGGVFVGSTVGGLVPLLWGESAMSFASIIGSTVGGGLGIWAGYQLSRRF